MGRRRPRYELGKRGSMPKSFIQKLALGFLGADQGLIHAGCTVCWLAAPTRACICMHRPCMHRPYTPCHFCAWCAEYKNAQSRHTIPPGDDKSSSPGSPSPATASRLVGALQAGASEAGDKTFVKDSLACYLGWLKNQDPSVGEFGSGKVDIGFAGEGRSGRGREWQEEDL